MIKILRIKLLLIIMIIYNFQYMNCVKLFKSNQNIQSKQVASEDYSSIIQQYNNINNNQHSKLNINTKFIKTLLKNTFFVTSLLYFSYIIPKFTFNKFIYFVKYIRKSIRKIKRKKFSNKNNIHKNENTINKNNNINNDLPQDYLDEDYIDDFYPISDNDINSKIDDYYYNNNVEDKAIDNSIDKNIGNNVDKNKNNHNDNDIKITELKKDQDEIWKVIHNLFSTQTEKINLFINATESMNDNINNLRAVTEGQITELLHKIDKIEKKNRYNNNDNEDVKNEVAEQLEIFKREQQLVLQKYEDSLLKKFKNITNQVKNIILDDNVKKKKKE